MKKLLLIVLTTGFFAFNSNAQVQRKADASQRVRSDSSHHFRRGGGMDNLNLTADQKAQMKSLRENNKQQREAIKNDASLTPDQKKAKMKDLYKAQSDKTNSILTPDQRAQRKANMEKMRADRKMHGKKGFKRSDTAPVQSKS